MTMDDRPVSAWRTGTKQSEPVWPVNDVFPGSAGLALLEPDDEADTDLQTMLDLTVKALRALP